MCFFKAHPLVNEQLLDYASSIAILSRRDFSNDIINPIETDSEILDSSNVKYYWYKVFFQIFCKVTTNIKESGSDYMDSYDEEQGLRMWGFNVWCLKFTSTIIFSLKIQWFYRCTNIYRVESWSNWGKVELLQRRYSSSCFPYIVSQSLCSTDP